MRILIISSTYPKLGDMSFAFVHARSKIYGNKGQKVRVFIPSTYNSMYKIERIHVYRGNFNFFKSLIEDFDPDVAAIHAPHFLTFKNHLNHLTKNKIPIVLWIHGSEALFQILPGYLTPWDIKSKIHSIFRDPIKLTLLRYLFLKSNSIVFVSKWMKEYTERHILLKHPFSVVIPNPIDTELFSFKRKSIEMACEGVSVRGLGWKYGLDIAIKAYSDLKKTHLTIIGNGPLENYFRYLAQRSRSNVSFITKPINHDKMPEIYHKYGYFLSPSRVEAQGVAMCEAMACGLPVIATNIGGIPEFVENEMTGLLIPPENPHILREAIMRLYDNEDLYNKLSEQGARFVNEKLSPKIIYTQEISVFKRCINEME